MSSCLFYIYFELIVYEILATLSKIFRPHSFVINRFYLRNINLSNDIYVRSYFLKNASRIYSWRRNVL